MCPACIAAAAGVAAGAVSAGGILAVSVGEFSRLFKRRDLELLQKPKEDQIGND